MRATESIDHIKGSTNYVTAYNYVVDLHFDAIESYCYLLKITLTKLWCSALGLFDKYENRLTVSVHS